MDILKVKIHKACEQYVHERIITANKAIESAQDAGADDTKSSAGDKYETGREMMKQELDRHQKLLFEAKQMETYLARLSLTPTPRIAPGSLVYTSRGLFYIAVAVGKLEVQGQEIFVLSPSSPVGKMFLQKSVGDTFEFNRTRYEILQIE